MNTAWDTWFTRILLCLAIATVLFCSTAKAGEWSRTEVAAEIEYQGLHLMDWQQTDEIARSNGKYFERDSAWLIGKSPSRAGVAGMMIANGVGHYLVSDYLVRSDAPKWVRVLWHVSTISVTASTVRVNLSIGL